MRDSPIHHFPMHQDAEVAVRSVAPNSHRISPPRPRSFPRPHSLPTRPAYPNQRLQIIAADIRHLLTLASFQTGQGKEKKGAR